MESTTKWVTNLRQSIKNTCGTGWSVRGRESKGELLSQVTFRYPDNQGRTAANVNLAWYAKNTTLILTATELLNHLMAQKNYHSKTAELQMELILQNNNNNFSRWVLTHIPQKFSFVLLKLGIDISNYLKTLKKVSIVEIIFEAIAINNQKNDFMIFKILC